MRRQRAGYYGPVAPGAGTLETMTNLAIEARGLSKQYRLGQLNRSYDTLRDHLMGALHRLTHSQGKEHRVDTIWALQDVSFNVGHGEVLGVIGRNGAGKTTLLKILSRITAPTSGAADVYGRLGSLLEVGTGFHPELTGRENIFLNGAILGMPRAEIRRKFDEIVDFAGIEAFLDTPVKRYSSGMYVRLAFAVAAHLEPDVLIVDEVLAVGDAEFQKKSLGKMREVTGQGRTVIFVSHNMASVRALCDRALLLRDGKLIQDADVDSVISSYIGSVATHQAAGRIAASTPRMGSGDAHFETIELLADDGHPISEAYLGQALRVVVTGTATKPVPDAVVEIGISTIDGIRVSTSFNIDGDRPPYELEPGRFTAALDLSLVLLPGHYTVDIGMHHTGAGYTIDYVERILDFEVLNVARDSADSYRYGTVRGFVRPEGSWSMDAREAEPLHPSSQR
jgi:lipopolysaccharide transport system ATP-binding protein